jgi:peptide deformylase
MLKIMYQEKGVGLAAPQIGISKRLVVVDLGFSGCPYKMVNPYIIERSEETIEVIEGCLSVPERVGPVKRSKSITVKYLNEHGQKKIIQAEELLAVCIQHEIDHLNGVLFVDNVEQFEKLTSSGLPL